MQITRIYFWTFPSMAMINCIYINLYRWQKKTQRYITTLTEMLITAVALNALLTVIRRTPLAITIATAVVYIIWLFQCSRDFQDFKMDFKDWLYLAAYTLLYIGGTSIKNVFVGATTYLIAAMLLVCTIHFDSIRWLLGGICERNIKK